MESEFEAFTRFMDRLLAVPHSEIKKRMERYRKKAAKNPRRRGPKPKAQAGAKDATRPSVSRAPAGLR